MNNIIEEPFCWTFDVFNCKCDICDLWCNSLISFREHFKMNHKGMLK